jgi:hypothetical protein
VLTEVGAPASPIGTYPAAAHVEVKAAAAMRRGEVKHGVLVINHPGGRALEISAARQPCRWS